VSALVPNRLFLLALAGVLLLVAPPAPGAEPLSVEKGASRTGDLVGLGRPISVDGEVIGAVVAIASTVRIAGRVSGDVILPLGGEVTFLPGARVGGDFLCVGCQVVGDATTAVAGHVRTLEALEASFLTELRTSPLRSAAVSPLLLAFRLAILTGWLLVGMILLYLGPRRVGAAARALPGRTPFLASLGATAALGVVLLSALLLSIVPAKAALFLVFTLFMALSLAKAFGLAVLFVALGRFLTKDARRGSFFFGDPAALSLGLLALGLLSLIPAAGPIVWAIATVIGIGLALETGFGREAAV